MDEEGSSFFIRTINSLLTKPINMPNSSGKNIIAANWKMNLLASQSVELAESFRKASAGLKKSEIWIAASATSIPAVSEILRESDVRYGGQNVLAPEGAYTGEVSVKMLQEFGCSFAVIGHSERRHVFGETDEIIVRRAKSALQANLGFIF